MYSQYKKCPYCLHTQDPRWSNEAGECLDRKRCSLQLLALVEERMTHDYKNNHLMFCLGDIRKEVRNG